MKLERGANYQQSSREGSMAWKRTMNVPLSVAVLRESSQVKMHHISNPAAPANAYAIQALYFLPLSSPSAESTNKYVNATSGKLYSAISGSPPPVARLLHHAQFNRGAIPKPTYEILASSVFRRKKRLSTDSGRALSRDCWSQTRSRTSVGVRRSRGVRRAGTARSRKEEGGERERKRLWGGLRNAVRRERERVKESRRRRRESRTGFGGGIAGGTADLRRGFGFVYCCTREIAFGRK